MIVTPSLLLPKSAKRIEGIKHQPQTAIALTPDTDTKARSVLLPYQVRWIEDRSRVKVYEKSRRIGISWADAYESVTTAASPFGMDCYYVGYNRAMTEQYIEDCVHWAKELNIELAERSQSLFNDEGKDILIFRVRLSSGHKITALSSKPTNLRSKKGRFIFDEFSFHPSPAELIKAGLASLMWGGSVAIISTHDGVTSEFYKTIERIKNKELDYSLHRTTLDDALREGLYKQICKVQGIQWNEPLEAQWRSQLFRDYGRSADEELLCIPSVGGRGMINPEWFIHTRYNAPPHRFDRIIISADTAAKARELNDPWCLLVWGIVGKNYYLLDCLIKRMEYPEGKRAIISLSLKWKPQTILIEDKSTGQSLIPELRQDRSFAPSVVAIVPTADKETRMSVETPAIESGQVWLPNAAPWLPEYEQALFGFPNGIKDPVDATSQFLAWVRVRSVGTAVPVGAPLANPFGNR